MKLTALAAVALTFGAGAAHAFQEKPFDAAAFAAAQSAGEPIVVDAFAPWCPVCKAQQTVLATLNGNPKYDKLVLFKIDYDHQVDALKSLNVRRQSTLVAFHGATETGRSVGDTQASSVQALFDTALK